MQVPWAQQVQERVGKSALVSLTERVADVARRIGQMITMGLPEVLDRHRPRHGKPRGRSWGWTAGRWRAYLRTAGEHRQVAGAAAITGMHHTLSPLRGQAIPPLDGRADRLGPLLQHVRQPP
jgi:hypothetical protein